MGYINRKFDGKFAGNKLCVKEEISLGCSDIIIDGCSLSFIDGNDSGKLVGMDEEMLLGFNDGRPEQSSLGCINGKEFH